jgi:hypothetical protein
MKPDVSRRDFLAAGLILPAVGVCGSEDRTLPAPGGHTKPEPVELTHRTSGTTGLKPSEDSIQFRIEPGQQVTISIPPSEPLADLAAERLAAYLKAVTGRSPRVASEPSQAEFVLQLAPLRDFRPDGYRIQTDRPGGRAVVLVTAPSGAGLKYGVHRLIRELEQDGKSVRVPALQVSANPWIKTRELFVAEIEWHPTPGETQILASLRKTFDWANWDDAMLEGHVDLMDAFGFNSLMTGDWEVFRQLSGAFISPEENTRKAQVLWRRARHNGMGTASTLRGQHGLHSEGDPTNDPEDPKGMANIREYWEYVLEKHGKLVDRWVIFWADPGGGPDIKTPQKAMNEFFRLLRAKGLSSDASFCLWALRWGSWGGVQDWKAVVNGGILDPQIGISMMRRYQDDQAHAIAAQYRKVGIWGWYTTDFEVCHSLHVHTHLMENELRKGRILRDQAGQLLDWYSLEDNNHLLNLPSLYVGAQLLWDPDTSADQALAEFCDCVWGGEAGRAVLAALQAIADIRCGGGGIVSSTTGDLWPNDFMCRLGRGTDDPDRDLSACQQALEGLDKTRPDSGHVPQLPLPPAITPARLKGYVRSHLDFVLEFARIRKAYRDALLPALEHRDLEETQRRMALIPPLRDVVAPDMYGALPEKTYDNRLRVFIQSWSGRTFRDNLALHKPVTASSWFNGDPRFSPAHAVNGLLCDAEERGWAAGAPGPAWIKIDLGNAHPVHTVRIYNRGFEWNPRDLWDPKLSATPQSGEVLLSAVDRDDAYQLLGAFSGWKPTRDPSAFQEVRGHAPVQARFVKVLLDPPANGQPAGAGEIEVR